MHTQTETVNVDRKMNISDALKETISTCSNENCEGREKDIAERQRYERKKQQQRNQSDTNNGFNSSSSASSYQNSSPRRFNSSNGSLSHGNRYNRLQNHQNGSNYRQNQNRNNVQHNYVNNSKSLHLDTNNNSNGNINSANNQSQQQQQTNSNFGYKTQNEQADNKKQMQKSRYITKSSQNANYDQISSVYNVKSSMRTENINNGGGNGGGDADSQYSGVNNDVQTTRKYTTDFLKHVGHQYNVNALLSTTPALKNQILLDESNLMAIKLAFGDNAHIYNSLGQQHQQYHQNFIRYQQQQLQQRMQLIHRHEQGNYQRNHSHSNLSGNRGFNNSSSSNNSNNNSTNSNSNCNNANNKDSSESSRHHTQQSLDNRSYQNAFYHQSFNQQQNTLPFQNRGKQNNNNNNNANGGNRDNYRRNRNQSSTNSTGAVNNDRYNNNKKLSNEQQRNAAIKNENINQDDQYKRKNLMYIRTNSDEIKYRSLSPTPPSSVKSASPGIMEKTCELKESNEFADDSESTASASSGPSALSYSSDNGKEIHTITPILLTTIDHDHVDAKEKSVDTWINNNNFGMLHNGLSISAEQLNTRPLDISSITVIKRPPSANEISTNNHQGSKHIYSVPRHMSAPSYDPAYPFDYYFARSDQSEMRIEPSNLKCGSVWDVLSKQMWDKFQVFQQTRDTYQSKMILWRQLYEYVKDFPHFQQRAHPKWGLFLVGSTISGFGLDSSDIDMCLVLRTAPQLDPRTEAMITLSLLKSYLLNSGSPFQQFYLINAKVPILRFRDNTNKIEVDLNYNNCIGVRNTHLLHCYAQLDWRLRPLAIIVKLWAQFHNINDARNSTISSYSLVLMVIHFLQYALSTPVLPCLHKMFPEKFQVLHDIMTIDMMETLETQWRSQNTQSLGELFLRFLDYYSNFNYARNAISIRTGGILPIEECKHVKTQKNDPNHWQTLCIEEPFDLTNTARSTYDGEIFEKIKSVFYNSWRRLKECKTLDVLFQDALFVQQQNGTQYQPPYTQMLKCIVYNPNVSQLISTSPINTEIAS